MWTMDELVERVREALAAEYPGAPNGRVRDVPDRRAIRWYATIGLVDRPLGMRGRTALYGPRHLEQLVAIKRRQAEGRSLSQIQAEFTFLTPQGLTDAAQVPSRLLAGDPPSLSPDQHPVRHRFWADAPTVPDAPNAPAASADPPSAAPVHGVALGGGAILLLPRPVSDRDRADLTAAAAPLLDLLTSRGLIDGPVARPLGDFS